MHAFTFGSVVAGIHDEAGHVPMSIRLKVNHQIRAQFHAKLGPMPLSRWEDVFVFHPSPNEQMPLVFRASSLDVPDVEFRAVYRNTRLRPDEHLLSGSIVWRKAKNTCQLIDEPDFLNVHEEISGRSAAAILEDGNHPPVRFTPLVIGSHLLPLKFLQENKRPILSRENLSLRSIGSPLQARDTYLRNSNSRKNYCEKGDDRIGIVDGPPLLFRRGIIVLIVWGGIFVPLWAWGDIHYDRGRKLVGACAMLIADLSAIGSMALLFASMLQFSRTWRL